jgi:hypothetical protein
MEASDIVKLINAFFSDASRSPSETLDGLRDIQSEVQSGIDALREEGVE